MLKLSDIRALNVEAASACTARCPFCSRGQKIRRYGTHRISLADVKKLPDDLVKGLRRITFAGNFGDLSCNPEMIDIARHLKTLNEKIVLGGETNGAAQAGEWWHSLGGHFCNGMMVFALDGLADTHALHRVGTDFKTVLENLQAFTAGGGQATWKFILFRHNEHQIAAAEALAEASGCRQFVVVSSRDYDRRLQKPKTFDIEIKRDIFQRYRKESAAAACKPFSDGSLYIAADGTVHPCCFAHCMYITEHNQRFRFILPLVERYRDQINFKTRQLGEIIAGPYFEEVLARSQKNAYCRAKCNTFKKKIRQELIVRQKCFDQGLRQP